MLAWVTVIAVPHLPGMLASGTASAARLPYETIVLVLLALVVPHPVLHRASAAAFALRGDNARFLRLGNFGAGLGSADPPAVAVSAAAAAWGFSWPSGQMLQPKQQHLATATISSGSSQRNKRSPH